MWVRRGACTQVKAYINGKREPSPPPAAPEATPAPEAAELEVVKGKVLVIGAGPAGLAAALQLKASRSHPREANDSEAMHHKPA